MLPIVSTISKRGVKFERLMQSSSVQSDAIYRSNASSVANPLISSYARFLGILKLDTNVTGSGADAFNNNNGILYEQRH